MGRRKIEMEKIVNTNKRMVAFSKRRGGIQRKATKLCKLFADIIVCIIVFSPGGKAFTFTNSPMGVCYMVQPFLEEHRKDKKQENKNVHSHKELDSVEKLKDVRESLAKLKQNLSERKEKVITSSSSLSPSPSSTIEDSIIIEDSDDEDCKTSITENHEARKTSGDDHHDLDLSLGWQLKETMSLFDKVEEQPPFLKRDIGHHMVKQCQSDPSQN
ncbi:agamous-like MADS-box protein AGL29 [Papaver somniferum]|uniref:agamous-like MADS-box protein AGL29 n=1 Tax=Papaver somniferum TaxID=3469 RepID=UPI000E6F8AA7|nr:agamous-like MADS-box protein AGL29 [Papaver somniferum]